jgi:hypothetical protein
VAVNCRIVLIITNGPEAQRRMDRLEQCILRDPGGRGTAALMVPGDLAAAARLLAGARRILILTGFPVGPGVAETDGPPGALLLGRALSRLGKAVAVATHQSCAPVVTAGMRWLGLGHLLAALAPEEAPASLLAWRPDLVVAVELPGRAADGQYHSMRGTVISAAVSPLDGLLPLCMRLGIPTVAVGDGGNEAGMGKVADRVRTAVPLGERIAAVIPADVLVVAGTSNWGCYGLLAALDPALVPAPAAEAELLRALVDAGALDGVTLQPAPTVDGIDPALGAALLAELQTLGQERQVSDGAPAVAPSAS